MITSENIVTMLESAGFNDYSIDYENGVAVVFFQGLPVKVVSL